MGWGRRVFACPTLVWLCAFEVFGEFVSFDVEVGKNTVEPARQPPGLVAEDRHDRGDEGHTDEERVDEDAEGEGEADLGDHGFGVEMNPANTLVIMIAAATTTRLATAKPRVTDSVPW